jgi:hypothetical protein
MSLDLKRGDLLVQKVPSYWSNIIKNEPEAPPLGLSATRIDQDIVEVLRGIRGVLRFLKGYMVLMMMMIHLITLALDHSL